MSDINEETMHETHEDAQEAPETTESTTTTPEASEAAEGHTEPQEDEDTFPRDYVEKLRDENAKYRQRAARADDLAHRLHTALVRATGKLQDPGDLPFDEEHLDDPEALAAAVDDLLARKPHLASRKPVGNIGQGASGSTSTVDLAGLLRARA